MTDLLALARALVPVCRAAGDVELKYFHEGAEVIDKLDGSPVTLADQEAEKLIVAELARLTPDIPIIGEESVAAGHVPDVSSGHFWLVDPLDGTKEFITGGGDFTVNIGLMRDFRPVMGVIFAPLSNELYFGAGNRAFMSIKSAPEQRISVRGQPAEGLTVVASKRHGDPEAMDEFLRGRKVASRVNRGSSLKFCVLAAGLADLYPRLAPTSEWDTAAGDAILCAAGGSVTLLDGKLLPYGKADRKFLNPNFVAYGLT